ncbi:putative Major facilitator superfamily domain-containing protein 1 [Hypsibius exemplaris]|uniref:Lysosomal dipeptide transporter MFSD1 n=1 Tax=Hypsibius exemplaris TaxID=2072580 RepID=A0A1W0WV71_HYPEX|nr:putative Major facilitator superfamily domain-containing protein 1 [Hypsibius exemplaris]
MSSVRWPVLAFTSIFCFTTDYFYDVPSVLHDRFIYNSTACHSGRDKCLHLTASEFNLLYAVYAWFGACIVPFSGILADKLGSRGTLFGFGILFFLGSGLFSYSTHLEDEQTAFILMLLGRLIFGVGNCSAEVITARLQTFWFRDRELGLAFAISIVAGRLGSVTNFLFTADLADMIGLRSTLWLGTVLCGVGLIGIAGASYYHTIGLRAMGRNAGPENNEPFQVEMIRRFTGSFWVLALFIVLFFAAVFPFVAEAPRYFADRYSYSQSYAGYVAGSTYDVALVSPLFGYLSDRLGYRGLWVLAAPAILFSAYVFLFLIPSFPPVLFCALMGLGYTLVAAIAWSCAPFLVPECGVGTALGLLTSFQMLGIGASNAIIGQLLSQGASKSKMQMWDDVLLFLGSCAGTALVLAVALNILDCKTGCQLRISQSSRRKLAGTPSPNNSLITDDPGSDCIEPRSDPVLSALIGRL